MVLVTRGGGRGSGACVRRRFASDCASSARHARNRSTISLRLCRSTCPSEAGREATCSATGDEQDAGLRALNFAPRGMAQQNCGSQLLIPTSLFFSRQQK